MLCGTDCGIVVGKSTGIMYDAVWLGSGKSNSVVLWYCSAVVA